MVKTIETLINNGKFTAAGFRNHPQYVSPQYVPFQPGIRGQLRQLLFQALSTHLQHLDPLLLSSLVKLFTYHCGHKNGIRMGYEW
jgi:hypothetical protein